MKNLLDSKVLNVLYNLLNTHVQKLLVAQYIKEYYVFILVITWLTRRYGSLPLPSIMREDYRVSRGRKSEFEAWFLACILLVYYHKVVKS
jgi:hypothetical protein